MTHRDHELLQKLHDAGVILSVEGDRLRYRAPAGVITSEMRAALAELKPTVVYEYHERAAIMEYDGHIPKTVAEGQATMDVLKTGRSA